MSIKTFIALALAISIPLASLLFTAGCESATDHSVDVTPAYSEVRVGQSVRLTATGWSDYTWSLSNTEIGYLTSTHGESVTYVVKTPLASASPTSTATAEKQTVMVTARNIASSSSSGPTNTVSGIYSGEATIMHLP